MHDQNIKLPYIRKICADLSENKILEIEEALIRYIRLCIDVGGILPVDDKVRGEFKPTTSNSCGSSVEEKAAVLSNAIGKVR